MLSTVVHFPGNCNEAISFYSEVVGAKVKDIAYFKDAPMDSGMESSLPPDFVMHSEILIFGSMVVMTDGAETSPTGDNFSFLVTKETADEVTTLYNKLLEGGKVIEALAPAFWASMYGMVEDRYGIVWQIMTQPCNASSL
ncbi:MAG: VOC family protein [Methanosarcinales archaeon]|jgi:PhnB protein|nr:VOC family protein [Methanosarcinales archaeon]